jgi:hypothetical protein
MWATPHHAHHTVDDDAIRLQPPILRHRFTPSAPIVLALSPISPSATTTISSCPGRDRRGGHVSGLPLILHGGHKQALKYCKQRQPVQPLASPTHVYVLPDPKTTLPPKYSPTAHVTSLDKTDAAMASTSLSSANPPTRAAFVGVVVANGCKSLLIFMEGKEVCMRDLMGNKF